jgi:RNA polymerase sigma-70 factor (ECF subfamily)
MTPAPEITELLVRWCDGDLAALDTLAPLVEDELHRLAHSFMNKERPGHMLQTTALVNEAFIRLVDQDRVRWKNRAHFFGIAGQIMRRTLRNFARDQTRVKRGGGAVNLCLDEIAVVSPQRLEELLVLDEAHDRLAAIDERMCRIVEMRYYGGLTVEETAAVLRVSAATIHRDSSFAVAWLAREMGPE